MRLFPVALGTCFMLAMLPAHARDSAVEARLDARGMKYEVDADGDYRMIVSYSAEKRTQLVFVSGSTESIEGLVVREVFSPVAKLGTHGIAGKALELLKESRKFKIGACEVGGDMLYYVIKLPDNIDAAQLAAAVSIAAENADNKEIQLTAGKDEF